MGPTTNGLENLLRLPTGCGEQNMLDFASSIYITRDLDIVGQLDSATRKKALKVILTGNINRMLNAENQSHCW